MTVICPALGKTWFTCAYGNAACRIGLKVRCYRVNRLLIDLAIGRGDGSYNKPMNDLKKPDLLILGDFGMSSLDPAGYRDLLEVIEERHGRKSTSVSSQLSVAQWHQVFEDATIADAVLDRLVYNVTALYFMHLRCAGRTLPLSRQRKERKETVRNVPVDLMDNAARLPQAPQVRRRRRSLSATLVAEEEGVEVIKVKMTG